MPAASDETIPDRPDQTATLADRLIAKLDAADALIGVVGLGYVGLPALRAFHDCGFRTLGFDIDPRKIERLNRGETYLKTMPATAIAAMVASGRFEATGDAARLGDADAILICVPTPLTRQREPDLSYVAGTAETLRAHLRRGQLIVLESTSYPGTTETVLKPLLEQSGLRSGIDFLLAYSPEREDPGNTAFATSTIPRVVAGDGADAARVAAALYGKAVQQVVPVSSLATAEAVKLTENIFRAVNIALVNELKQVYGAMDIDIWEVIEAAKTKPFGYMPFYPGPGLGGHCIPIDPFYLAWKAREYGVATRFIELAGEINTQAPSHVVAAVIEALSTRLKRSLAGSRILILGAAYKKNIDDTRESPALQLMEMLAARGAEIAYYDPFIPELPPTRKHGALAGRHSVAWDLDAFRRYDLALICTDHDGVDYAGLVAALPCVVDTRNATRAVAAGRDRIVLA
ncbi:MAG: nucleotide sugar dehydrogenase [Aliidongia sp.]